MQPKKEMNKIALVGPGGRKELKSYIKNLEDTIKNLQGRIEELENPPTPEMVTDITALTDEQLDTLEVGDKVIKVTGVQKHLYLVTYKGEGAGEGICLSYNAAGYGETVAYDRTESGWAYNSTDIKTYGE